MIDRILVFMGMRCGCNWCRRRRDWAGLGDRSKRINALFRCDPESREMVEKRPEDCKEAR